MEQPLRVVEGQHVKPLTHFKVQGGQTKFGFQCRISNERLISPSLSSKFTGIHQIEIFFFFTVTGYFPLQLPPPNLHGKLQSILAKQKSHYFHFDSISVNCSYTVKIPRRKM